MALRRLGTDRGLVQRNDPAYANSTECSRFLDNLVVIGYEATIGDSLEMSGDRVTATVRRSVRQLR